MNYSARTVYRDDEVAAVYERRRFSSLRGRLAGELEIRRMLSGLERLGVARGALVLDVPAGTGRLTSCVLSEGYKAMTVDISQAMLRQAFLLHHLDGEAAFLGAVSGEVERLPLPDQSVDAVLSLRLMGHLPLHTKERAIAEMMRVARAGAVVMFARRTRLLRFKRSAMWTLGARPRAQHWFDHSDPEIRALIQRNGGRVIAHEDLLGPFAESRAYIVARGEAH